MMRVSRTILSCLGILAGALFLPVTSLHAQAADNGSICILVYEDVNNNQSRDPGEAILKNVGIDLAFGENVLIANHITDGSEPFCFQNLAFNKYTVRFKSQAYDPTTPASVDVTLSAQNAKVDVGFGAISKATPTPVAPEQKPGLNINLTIPVRIGLSAVGALLAMGFLLGVGLMIYGLFLRR